ncbi:MAG: GNAT family N-acetyltransferase [Cellvibrio sp.]|uniref:GNAT family N-acetyltransferase n=1 Tax=Cellvibrio sp. TaxID=1965322 RepID=UPI0031B2D1FD
MNLDQCNIDNLTSLWRKMGVEKNSEFTLDGLTVSQTWPNRFWFDWSASAEQMAAIDELLPNLPARAVVPVWLGAGEKSVQLERDLLDKGFSVSFQQLAMYLDLQTAQPEQVSALDITKVQTQQDLEAWTTTASAAFGYWIDISAIANLIAETDVTLLLVKQNGEPVATALVYQTGEIIGAHLVGVPEAYRGRGIARALMHHVIKLSIELDGKYLTLQASLAGEPLYRQLGFVPQFVIKNYHRI